MAVAVVEVVQGWVQSEHHLQCWKATWQLPRWHCPYSFAAIVAPAVVVGVDALAIAAVAVGLADALVTVVAPVAVVVFEMGTGLEHLEH